MTTNDPSTTADSATDPASEPLHDPRHEAFALGSAKGFEPTYAYFRAGYSSKNAKARAERLLKDPPIAARIHFLRIALPRAEQLLSHHSPSFLLMPETQEEMAAFFWQVTTGVRPIRPHQLRAAYFYCRLKGWHRLKPKGPGAGSAGPNKKKSKDKDQEVKFAGGNYIDPVTGRRRLFPPDDPNDPTAFVNPDGSITKGNNRILPGGWIDTPYIVWPENLEAETTPVPLDFVPEEDTTEDHDNPAASDTTTGDDTGSASSSRKSKTAPLGPAERQRLNQIIKDTVEADLDHRVQPIEVLDLFRTGLCTAWYRDIEPLLNSTAQTTETSTLATRLHHPFTP